MVENNYGIDKIVIHPEAKCFCPLGADWYTNHFEVTIGPDQKIPDYCALDVYIAENINGKELIIEEAVDLLYQHIVSIYQPRSCRIVSHVNDAGHSDVSVFKTL